MGQQIRILNQKSAVFIGKEKRCPLSKINLAPEIEIY
jgi:hypothetical protein